MTTSLKTSIAEKTNTENTNTEKTLNAEKKIILIPSYIGDKCIDSFVKKSYGFIKKMNKIELEHFKKQFSRKKEDEIHSPCIITYQNGDIYKGEVNSNGEKHGLGELFCINGNVFACRWKNNKSNGSGIYITNIGIYRGYWEDDYFHGKNNKIIFPTGEYYIGNVVKGCMTGFGIYHFLNGDYYSGYFENGIRCRYGTYYWANGNCYQGYWKNNIADGCGIFYAYNIGKIYICNWENGLHNKPIIVYTLTEVLQN